MGKAQEKGTAGNVVINLGDGDRYARHLLDASQSSELWALPYELM